MARPVTKGTLWTDLRVFDERLARVERSITATGGVSGGGGGGTSGPNNSGVGGGNYVPNPAFEAGLTGYTSGSDNTLTLSTSQGLFGANCASVQRITTSGDVVITSPNFDVAPNRSYCATASVRLGILGSIVARSATISIDWRDGLGDPISVNTSSISTVDIQGDWLTVKLNAQFAPATCTNAYIIITVLSAAIDETFFFDGFQFEPGTSATSFTANFASALTGSMMVPETVTAREAGPGSARTFFGPYASLGTVIGMSEGCLYWATDTNQLFFYDSAAWNEVTASSSSPAQPRGLYDFPYTIDPRVGDANRSFTANNIYYHRVQSTGTCNGLGYHQAAAVASATVTMAIYSNTGTARNSRPGTLVTGSVAGITTAAPGVGATVNMFKQALFDAPVVISHGDWIAYTASASVAVLTGAPVVTMQTDDVASAFSCFQTGGGPTMPSTPGSLFAQTLTPVIVGT